MTKLVGVDLGTNSIGLAVRDDEKGKSIIEQLVYFTSVIFESGVGRSKTGEFSYAADRTKHRSSRRLYQARKYRKWATLLLLIENNYCPLTIEELDEWKIYDKSRGLKRKYPVDAEKFEQWIRLDFNGDGVADYSSPYQLRAELMQRQFDFDNLIDRYKFGRAIYHIAQRRGFKSSKGETIKEQEQSETLDLDTLDMSTELKKSEEKKSKAIFSYMEQNNLPTVGCALAKLELEGIRVRNSIYQPVRSQYKDELVQIFRFQNGVDENGDFCKRVLSEKKDEGTVFYKRPLRSQKGTVGNCTLEPSKPRCQITHPDFEDFRAWSFINNIKYRPSNRDEWQEIDLSLKRQMLEEKFMRAKSSFKFLELREWLQKKMQMQFSYSEKTINYNDKTSVSGCPVSARIKGLLGDEWRTVRFETDRIRTYESTGKSHTVSYDYEDVWHICATADEAEDVERIAQERFGFDDVKIKKMVSIWGSMQQGYAMLSLKAIRNINRFLHKGLIYSDAVLLAKVPEILGEELWNENERLFLSSIRGLTESNREQKMILGVVNTLIASYKALEIEGRYGNKDVTYKLDDSDVKDVKNCIIDCFGEKSWNELALEKKNAIENRIIALYQEFFASEERDYYHLPKLGDSLKQFLYDNFDFLQNESGKKKLNKLYHPSQIDIYPKAKEELVDCSGRLLSKKLLYAPTLGSIKNPVVMRALHTLRHQINALIKAGYIDEDTRVVVETARDLNDANMRWAIEQYQREREQENKKIAEIILDNCPNMKYTDDDIDKARLLLDQHDIQEITAIVSSKGTKEEKEKFERYKKDVTKYKLWLEQGCRCIYTGRIINITSLFDPDSVDFEHTIPRSISFDSSLSNLTVCDADFNRKVKQNRIPSQLSNYEEILLRIQPWIDKVERLKNNVEFWKGKAKRAADKDRKDDAIRQRHLWEFELEYWQRKVNAFLMKSDEITLGFRNSQLVDTRIITKYAYHYLKSVFNRVDVQKGSATADFRKMLGIQSLDEKKSRDKHSHHAIDATVLTLIPVAAKREKMMKLFYEIQEAKHLGNDCSKQQSELQREIDSCHLGDVSPVVGFIENNILINHISKDQALTPAKRRLRRRGKVVHDKNGNEIWLSGDSIRGQLHKDSFFGAIKNPKRDANGNLLVEKGNYIYEETKDGQIVLQMVIRVPIGSLSSQKDLEKIIDPQVKYSIMVAVERIMEQCGKTFEQAVNEPIWMIDKSGNEIKEDKNGRKLSPIRHVRCKVAAGRGFFTKDKAVVVKEQTYKSHYDYKNYYYAQNDSNYLCLLYEGVNKGKFERKFVLINLFEVANLGVRSIEDIQKEPHFEKLEEGKKIFSLSAIIKVGTRVLMWKESPEELLELEKCNLNKRLYVVYKFNSTGVERIYLQNHIEARNDKDIEKDMTVLDTTQYQPRLNMVANSFNCMIEGRDFEITTSGNIVFK